MLPGKGSDRGKRLTQSRKKTVFLLGSYAPSLVKFRGALIGALVARGHEVIAAAPDIDNAVAGELEALGARPLSIPMQRTGTNPLRDLSLLSRLTRILRETGPDIFVPYTVKPVVWGSLAAHRTGIPLIAPMITGLGYAFAPPSSSKQAIVQKALIRLYRAAITKAHVIFFQNPDDVATLRAYDLLPSHLAPTMINGSGVDLEFYAPAPLPEAPHLLMIARLIGAKGVREYADAAGIVRKTHPDTGFSLVGWIDDGPDAIAQGELDQWIAQGIDYRGVLNDVRPAIAGSSIYVLPSYREGTPRSVLEAMAMGRPVITTDAPGCRETVEEGVNGCLVPPRNGPELARAMIRLIEDPQLRRSMGRQSRRIAEDKFDVHKVNETILRALGLVH